MAKSKEYELAIKIAGQIEKSFLGSMNITKKELQSIAKEAAATSNATKHSFQKGMKDVGPLFKNLEKVGVKALKAVTTAAVAGASAIVTASIKVGSSYEEQMSTVQSISGVTAEEIKALGEKAKYMGATTKFSATEAGQALEYMAMAGWKTKDMLNGIEGIMNLAAASGEELAMVSDIVTDALTAFGMAANESGKFADILAAASSNSNTNVAMLGESFKYAAPVAGALGYTAEDTAIALGLMANAGIKASMSGTALRAAFTNMVNPSDKMAAAMNRLGISATNEDGSMKTLLETMDMLRTKMKGLSEEEIQANLSSLYSSDELAKMSMQDLTKDEIFNETALGLGLKAIKEYNEAQLNSALSKQYKQKELAKMTEAEKRNMVAMEQGTNVLMGLTEAEQAAASAQIFGKNAMSGMLAIINASEKDYRKLIDAVYSSEGAAKAMSEIRLDNLIGDVTILKSGMEGFGIDIYEQIKGPLRQGVQIATTKLGELNKAFKKNLPTAIRHVKDFTGSVIDFAEPLINIAVWLIKHPDVIVGTIIGIGSAIATYKVASGVLSLVTGFKKLAGILTNPFAVGILAVGAAIGVGAGIGYHIKRCAEEAKKANLEKHFGNISLSLEELQQVAGYIIQNKSLGKVKEALSAIDGIDEIQRSIDGTVEALNKANWKISIGMELTETETQEYIDNISSYVSGIQDFINQEHYALTLSVQALLGINDLEQNNFITQINTFYKGKEAELVSLGEEMQVALSKAITKDGLFIIDELDEVRRIQASIAKIKEEIAISRFEAKLDVLGMEFGNVDSDSFQNLQIEVEKQVEAETTALKEALEYALQGARSMLRNGKDANEQPYGIKEFEEDKKALMDGYLRQVSDLQLYGINWQLNTIMNQYNEELEKAIPGFEERFESAVNEAMTQIELGALHVPELDALLQELSKPKDLDKTTRGAITDLFKGLQPLAEQLESLEREYRVAGNAIPESIHEGIMDAATIGALIGDADSVVTLIGDVASRDEYKATTAKLAKSGHYLLEAIAEAIKEKQPVINRQIDSTWKLTQDAISSSFGKGMDVTIPLRVSTKESLNPFYSSLTQKTLLLDHVGYRANGGIVTKPELSWIAEAGYSESVIPHDGSQNAFNLWKKTGEILGVQGFDNLNKNGSVFDSTSENSLARVQNDYKNKVSKTENYYEDSSQVAYSPINNYYFYGETPSKKDLEEVNRNAQAEFEERYHKMKRNEARVSFRR